MFTYKDLRALLKASPFVPFRLHLSEGNYVDVKHPEFVLPGGRYAVIGLVDPAKPEAPIDRHVTIFYLHVNRIETLMPSPFPGGSSGESAGTPGPVLS